ncbi:hypothetical protein B4N89_45800 [Embleya scabrispora]|uniref:Uncharacterized protein n=1 Tax=Embleya scabrispora TaxID=159449 RepID=A0A1T3NJ06_9ACTN|nr:hypothetical protein B4N89_45800 [Embleya scabrispora]
MHPWATLTREAYEEASAVPGASVYLGYLHDHDALIYAGTPVARVRYAARVTRLGPARPDPATGREWRRLLVDPATAVDEDLVTGTRHRRRFPPRSRDHCPRPERPGPRRHLRRTRQHLEPRRNHTRTSASQATRTFHPVVLRPAEWNWAGRYRHRLRIRDRGPGRCHDTAGRAAVTGAVTQYCSARGGRAVQRAASWA